MKTKILFVIPNLKGGGSERVISLIIANINQDIFDVHLLLGEKEGVFLDVIPEYVKIYSVGKKRVIKAIVPIIKKIKQINPHLVVSTLGHLNILLALFGFMFPPSIKFIARESNTISERNKDERFPILFNILFKTVYQRFDKIICQCEFMKNDLIDNYSINPSKLAVINNPVDINLIERLGDANKNYNIDFNKINIAFIGSLNDRKRPEIAINLISKLTEEYHLHVIGAGEKSNQLNLYCKTKCINNITFYGFLNNPFEVLSKCNYLVSTSLYEGFPNVLLEANALGVPVVSFSYPGGVSEIINHGENGFLVRNNNFNDLLEVFQNKKSVNLSRKQIKNMTKDKYGIPKIIYKYEMLFAEILNS